MLAVPGAGHSTHAPVQYLFNIIAIVAPHVLAQGADASGRAECVLRLPVGVHGAEAGALLRTAKPQDFDGIITSVISTLELQGEFWVLIHFEIHRGGCKLAVHYTSLLVSISA